jgi:hypothetical protein
MDPCNAATCKDKRDGQEHVTRVYMVTTHSYGVGQLYGVAAATGHVVTLTMNTVQPTRRRSILDESGLLLSRFQVCSHGL